MQIDTVIQDIVKNQQTVSYYPLDQVQNLEHMMQELPVITSFGRWYAYTKDIAYVVVSVSIIYPKPTIDVCADALTRYNLIQANSNMYYKLFADIYRWLIGENLLTDPLTGRKYPYIDEFTSDDSKKNTIKPYFNAEKIDDPKIDDNIVILENLMYFKTDITTCCQYFTPAEELC